MHCCSYYISNALNSHQQSIVRHVESLEKRFERANLAKTFVVDYKQRIDILRQFINSVKRTIYSYFSLHCERNGNYSNRKHTRFLRFAGNYRCSPCSCSAAHTCSYKDHACAIRKHFVYFVKTFFCNLSTSFRITSRPKSVLPQLATNRHGILHEIFVVGVANFKTHVMKSFLIHSGNSIATAATNAYNFYYSWVIDGHDFTVLRQIKVYNRIFFTSIHYYTTLLLQYPKKIILLGLPICRQYF